MAATEEKAKKNGAQEGQAANPETTEAKASPEKSSMRQKTKAKPTP